MKAVVLNVFRINVHITFSLPQCFLPHLSTEGADVLHVSAWRLDFRCPKTELVRYAVSVHLYVSSLACIEASVSIVHILLGFVWDCGLPDK